MDWVRTMSKEILDYIEEHLIDIREAYDNADGADPEFHYYEGLIEAFEHLLAKFGRHDGA